MVVHTYQGVEATVTKEKWDKTHAFVKELCFMHQVGDMAFKCIEQIREFLIYVAGTYKLMT